MSGSGRKADQKSGKPYEGRTKPQQEEIPGKNLRFGADSGLGPQNFHG